MKKLLIVKQIPLISALRKNMVNNMENTHTDVCLQGV